jgi:eukaryotic-like serine/threonine-protein kinase
MAPVARAKAVHTADLDLDINVSLDDLDATWVQSRPPTPTSDESPATSTHTSHAQSLDALQRLPTLELVGRYALKHLLGQGGLGTVHAAVDPLLQRPVALKRLHSDSLQRPFGQQDGAARDQDALLLTEARHAASLSHPNIVTVFDAGRDARGVYVAMERLDGMDLRQRLRQGWRPSPWQAAAIVARVADALAYAHAKGLVHCDIKPSNIFMLAHDQPKVVDFGIARVRTSSASATTAAARAATAAHATPVQALSPIYAAPEQLQDTGVDERSDLYALGVVLYELLTGQRPFVGATMAEVKQRVIEGHPPHPQHVAPHLPMPLAAIALKAMALDPSQRYANATTMRADLERVIAHHERLDRWRTRADTGLRRRAADGSLWRQGATAVAPLVMSSRAWAAGGCMLLGVFMTASVVWREPLTRDTQTTVARLTNTVPEASSVAWAAPTAEQRTPRAAEGLRQQQPNTLAIPLAAPPLASSLAQPTRSTQAKNSLMRTAKPAPDGRTVNVRLAIAPWGQVEVNGRDWGATPPLTALALPPGQHRIVVRNADFEPYVATVHVKPEQTDVRVAHRFGD